MRPGLGREFVAVRAHVGDRHAPVLATAVAELQRADLGQDGEPALGVDGLLDAIDEPGQLDQLRQQLVVVRRAVVAALRELAQAADEFAHVGHRHRRRRGLRQDAVVDEVPVLAEQQGERPDVLEVHAQRHREQQRLGDGVVVEQRRLQLRPAFLERDRRADLVLHVDDRRQPRLDRVLGEQALRERVQRADRGAVEVVERLLRRVVLIRIGSPHLLELGAQPVAQFGARLLGERHRGDVAQPHAVVEHERLDPADQRGRLARPGAGVHEQRRGGIGADALPLVLVLQCRGHTSASASGSIRATSSASSGSSRLRSQRSRFSPWPMPSGLQYSHCT